MVSDRVPKPKSGERESGSGEGEGFKKNLPALAAISCIRELRSRTKKSYPGKVGDWSSKNRSKKSSRVSCLFPNPLRSEKLYLEGKRGSARKAETQRNLSEEEERSREKSEVVAENSGGHARKTAEEKEKNLGDIKELG